MGLLVCAGGANSAFSADMLDQLRVLRQQLEAARDEQRKLEEDKTQVRVEGETTPAVVSAAVTDL